MPKALGVLTGLCTSRWVTEGRGMYGCFFFNERRAIEGAIILGIGPTIFAVFELRKVQDVFGIGLEIVRVVIPLVTCAGMSNHGDGF